MKPVRVFIISLGLLLCACSTTQRTLPSVLTKEVPWGAINVQTNASVPLPTPDYGDIVVERFRAKMVANPGEKLQMNMLLMSGGGIRGNYGAGVINGWSKTGTRPEFDLVTGVSVGALMATYAFLGSEYDDLLKHDAFEAVGVFSSEKPRIRLFSPGDQSFGRAFAALLEQSVTEEIIDAVAREYMKGRRLYIGTTNLDASRFVIWDMGLIASSDRDDRAQIYRKVLLASASVPGLFPPVMFEIEAGQKRYEQMHVDGGITENVFVADYDLIWEQVLSDLDITRNDMDIHAYVLHNGRLFDGPPTPPVPYKSLPVMGSSISTLMSTNSAGGVYKLWLMSMISGVNFHLASIPPDVTFNSSLTEVDREDTAHLYMQGYQRGRNGIAWHTQLPPATLDEVHGKLSADLLQNSFERNFLNRKFKPDSTPQVD